MDLRVLNAPSRIIWSHKLVGLVGRDLLHKKSVTSQLRLFVRHKHAAEQHCLFIISPLG